MSKTTSLSLFSITLMILYAHNDQYIFGVLSVIFGAIGPIIELNKLFKDLE